jgi:prolyl-tRNA synthetase
MRRFNPSVVLMFVGLAARYAGAFQTASRHHLARHRAAHAAAASVIRTNDAFVERNDWQGRRSNNRLHSFRLLSTAADLSEEQKLEIEAKIKAKGDEIRAMKDDGADKAAVAPLVQELLSLKAQLDPSMLEDKKKKKPQQQKKQQNQQQQQQQQSQKKGKQPQKSDSDEESDFITARAVDYSKWYNDLIRVTGLAETSPVRGCMVIKPWGMSLWDKIRTELDVKIKEHGAENAYFPLLIPKSFLSKEAEHVDGFAKECAVVTHHRLTAGEDGLIADPEAELEDPLIIRPTSETMIWYMFRKWINSHR